MSRQVHLAAHFPGVNNTTVWTEPDSGSQIDFASFRHLADTAEQGLFDFFFLAEGLRLREHLGRIHDLDVVGRPDTFAVLNALAATTARIGLAGTINATFNEPYELARQFSALDHLSGGRAGWNVVTSSDAFTGENFRRGGFLPHAQRYERAAEAVQLARELWDSWPDATADPATETYVRPGAIRPVRHSGEHFDIAGRFSAPRSPQGHPVLIQAGDSPQGRDFGAATADVLFTRHGTLAEGKRFRADVRNRAAARGRDPDELKVLPAATFVLGRTEREAHDRAREIRRAQVGPRTAINQLEQVWGRDLSGHDPEGPLPETDPEPDVVAVQGKAAQPADRIATARRWRELARERGLSTRELIIEVTGRATFVGTPDQVAAQLDEHVQAGACDGFVLVPHLTPGGLDEFVADVVPRLQDRGVHRTAYRGTTLRDHLGLSHPH